MHCPMEAGGSPDLLLDYAAGTLNDEVRGQTDRHLAGCRVCSEFVAAQQTVWRALDDWEPADVSMDFDRRLYARIEQDVPWWKRLMRPLNPVFRHSLPIGAAAGVIIAAGLMLYWPAAIVPAQEQRSAQVESLQPDQLQSALEDMEMLHQFNQLVPDDSGPKM